MNTVDCPYCGHEHDESDLLSNVLPDLDDDNQTDYECEHCEEEFEVSVEFEPSAWAEKIEYTECDRCKSEVRDIFVQGRVLPFPEERGYKKLCRNCFSEEYRQEIEKNKGYTKI